jgi:hypothetical protein
MNLSLDRHKAIIGIQKIKAEIKAAVKLLSFNMFQTNIAITI